MNGKRTDLLSAHVNFSTYIFLSVGKFNIDLSKRTKHNALLDCELLREVYINLLDAKEPKLIFLNENIESNLESRTNNKKNYCKTVIKPTNEEVSLHKDFLKKELKKNYY